MAELRLVKAIARFQCKKLIVKFVNVKKTTDFARYTSCSTMDISSVYFLAGRGFKCNKATRIFDFMNCNKVLQIDFFSISIPFSTFSNFV